MKIGIAGAGFMGTTHAQAWSKTEAQIEGALAETGPAHAILRDAIVAMGAPAVTGVSLIQHRLLPAAVTSRRSITDS